MGLEHLLLGLCAADKRLMSSSKLDLEKGRRVLREHRSGSSAVRSAHCTMALDVYLCVHPVSLCTHMLEPVSGRWLPFVRSLRSPLLVTITHCQAAIFIMRPRASRGSDGVLDLCALHLSSSASP